MPRPKGWIKGKTLAQKFAEKVRKSDGCWEMECSHTGAGYAQLCDELSHTVILAHRFSYELHYGIKPPSDKEVMHVCDNPGCVNPEHLMLGSHRDNMYDMIAKGRQPSGDSHYHAKLTTAIVKNILLLVSAGVNQSKIARMYGVNPSTICDIIRRRTWKHITHKNSHTT